MALPPAQPAYIFRGHAAQIHSTTFIRRNSRLITGDADGWVIVWSVTTKRATAVWRAHEGTILGCAEWGVNRLITHGKDNKLIVWKFSEGDEASLQTTLPVEDSVTLRNQPWLLHVLNVNTLNFCSFAHCEVRGNMEVSDTEDPVSTKVIGELFLAVPNTMSSEAVDIFHLPSEKRIHTVSGDKSVNTGMVMAVAIFYQGKSLTLAVGYESGHAMLCHQVGGNSWQVLYMSHPHSQPILSLDVSSNKSFFLTSSADAIIAKHPIPDVSGGPDIKHAVHSSATAEPQQLPAAGGSLLSSGLAASNTSKGKGRADVKIEITSTPLKIVQTKHSGQQGLQIRSDGKIFATAGWDSKVRVYSMQTLKELAVLKWHKEGCFAVGFADVLDPVEGVDVGEEATEDGKDGRELVVSRANMSVRERRVRQAISTHWLAAGSKDGKVSLWDIY